MHICLGNRQRKKEKYLYSEGMQEKEKQQVQESNENRVTFCLFSLSDINER
jgi:hypothetical protein